MADGGGDAVPRALPKILRNELVKSGILSTDSSDHSSHEFNIFFRRLTKTRKRGYKRYYWNFNLKVNKCEYLDFLFDGLVEPEVEQTNDVYSYCYPMGYEERKKQKKIAFPFVPNELYFKKYKANPILPKIYAINHIQAMIELGDMVDSTKSAKKKSVKKKTKTKATGVDELVNKLGVMELTSKTEESYNTEESSVHDLVGEQTGTSYSSGIDSHSCSGLLENMDFRSQMKTFSQENLQRYYAGMKVMPIYPTEANFLNKALVSINPSFAAEPFYAMGIEVIAVADMKEIYTLEQIPLEEYIPESKMQLEIDQQLIELKEFLYLTLNLNKNIEQSDVSKEREHFLSKLVSAIVQTDEKGTTMLSDEWLQLERKYTSNNSLVKFISTELQKLTDYLPHNFSESDLQQFVLEVLNGFKGWYCKLGKKINIDQFRHTEDDKTQSQKCTPDLEFYRIADGTHFDSLMLLFELKAPTMSTYERWTPQMHNVTTKEDDMKSFKLKSTLLWQHTEAMFGKIMKRSTAEDAAKMLQGGILVCNDRIRNVVFVMDTKIHREMNKKRSARETLAYFERQPYMWARLYVDANEYGILEVINQCLYTRKNFCK